MFSIWSITWDLPTLLSFHRFKSILFFIYWMMVLLPLYWCVAHFKSCIWCQCRDAAIYNNKLNVLHSNGSLAIFCACMARMANVEKSITISILNYYLSFTRPSLSLSLSRVRIRNGLIENIVHSSLHLRFALSVRARAQVRVSQILCFCIPCLCTTSEIRKFRIWCALTQ